MNVITPLCFRFTYKLEKYLARQNDLFWVPGLVSMDAGI